MKKTLLLLVSLTLTIVAHANQFTYKGITYYALSDTAAQTFADLSGAPILYEGELTIPDTVYDESNNKYFVESIGEYSFRSNKGLTKVVLPKTLRSIGDYAFSQCSGLTGIDIPQGVSYIGEGALEGCVNIEEIVIPNSIFYLGERFIGGSVADDENPGNIISSKLSKLTIEAGTPPTANSAFSALLDSTVILFVPDSALLEYQNNDEYNSHFKAIYGYNIGKVNVMPTAFKDSVQFTWFGDRESVRYELYLRKGSELVAVYDIDSKGNAKKRMIRRLPSLTNDTTTSSTEMFVVSLGGVETNVDYGYEVIGMNSANQPSFTTSGSFKVTASGVENTQAPVVQIKYCFLSVLTADPAMGTVKGGGTYQQNVNATIEAIANKGFRFIKWNDGNTENPRTVKVSEDMAFTATFEIIRHTITVESANPGMGAVSGSGTYDYGTEITISAKPNQGFKFIKWNDDNTQQERKITVTADATFSAVFDHIYYTINAKSADEKMGTVTGGGTYQYAHKIHLTATPQKGYEFVQWNDGVTDNPRYFSAMEDATYIAEFKIMRLTVTVNSADDQMGTVSGGGTFDYGTEITISATPKKGYEFLQWNDGNNLNPRQVIVETDKTYTAQFALKEIPKYTITVQAEEEYMGTVSGGGVYPEGDTHYLEATPNKGYKFVGWKDGVTDNPRNITVTENATYIALFEVMQFTVTVQSSDLTMGTVEGGGTFDFGQEIQISAIPNKGYEFVRWDDGNTQNPRTISVNENITYTAEFRLMRFTINAESADESMGTVNGGGTYYFSTNVVLTATPAEGYEFVEWDDGVTDNPRKITVTEEATFTAHFRILQFTVSAVAESDNLGTVDGGGTYDYGTEVTLTATPAEGYRFEYWSDGATDNPRTVTVTENCVFTAVFVPIDQSVNTAEGLNKADIIMIDGMIYIRRNNTLFDLQGKHIQ